MATRVADLSVDELRDLIHEVMTQTIEDLFRDPDIGLELQAHFSAMLEDSLQRVEAGEEILPMEAVAANLGLNW